jgi:hypothetical protein
LKVHGHRAVVDTNVVRSLLVVKAGAALLRAGDHDKPAEPLPSDLFSLAQVSLDTAAFDPADSLVPVIVKRGGGEAPHGEGERGLRVPRIASASAAGFGVRNFLGSGRILDVSARASKIGVASSPGIVDWNLENSLLPRASRETESARSGSRKINYNRDGSRCGGLRSCRRRTR